MGGAKGVAPFSCQRAKTTKLLWHLLPQSVKAITHFLVHPGPSLLECREISPKVSPESVGPAWHIVC